MNQLAHLIFVDAPRRRALKLRRRQPARCAQQALATKLPGQPNAIDIQSFAAARTQHPCLRSQLIKT